MDLFLKKQDEKGGQTGYQKKDEEENEDEDDGDEEFKPWKFEDTTHNQEQNNKLEAKRVQDHQQSAKNDDDRQYFLCRIL